MQKYLPWFLAIRPKTLAAAFVPVIGGSALGYVLGSQQIPWFIFICILCSIFALQAATNLFNDALDFQRGADTLHRMGPTRVTQSKMLTERQVVSGGLACLALAILFGIPIVLQGGWPYFVIGLLSCWGAYAYTGGRWALAYLGLGEIFVVLFFGWLATCGTYTLIVPGWPPAPVWIAGLQIGLLATALLVVNNFRDREGDARVGKKTLCVRWGHKFARFEIVFIYAVVYGLQPYWWKKGFGWAAVLPLMTSPLAVRVIASLYRPPSSLLNKTLAKAAGILLLFGIFFTTGLLLR